MSRPGSSRSRLAPGKNDRHGREGTPMGVAQRRRRELAPPEPKAGQVSCPVCRNATATTSFGHLRKHRDLFGNDCYNRRPA